MKHKGDYCEICLGMTTTSKGLDDLFSESGYEHYSVGELKESQSRGCPLCQIIPPSTIVGAKDVDQLKFFAQFEHRPF